MENKILLHAALFLFGAIYLGGIPYLAFQYGHYNYNNLLAEDWGQTEPENDHSILVADIKKLNNKLKTAGAIPEEKMLRYEKHFPYDLTSVTTEGCPVLYIRMSNWKTPEEVENLKQLTFHKYLDNMLGAAFSKTIPMSVATGKSSKFYVLINMEGAKEDSDRYEKYLDVTLKVMGLLFKNYRSHFGKQIYINAAPSLIELHSDYAALHPKDMEMIEMLGEGRDAWGPKLFQRIAQHELPKELQEELDSDADEE